MKEYCPEEEEEIYLDLEEEEATGFQSLSHNITKLKI